MLLWQLKNVRNRHLLWLKLVACSFVMHLFFVGILFFGYRDSGSSHKFTMHNHAMNKQVAIVLVPTTHKANISAAKQTTIANAIDHNVKVAKQKKSATKIMQPKQTKKVMPKKPAPAKIVPKKVVSEKIESKKITPVKKIEHAAAKAPAKIEKPAVAKALAGRPKITEPKSEVAAIPVQKNLTTAAPVSAEVQTIEIPYNQAREFYQQEALRKELSRHWTPPHGIPDTCMCEITTYVGNNGMVTDSVITQSSGILMYDVSARAAILAMDLPRWTWGSSFTITFKP